jgi:hypothetical protein
MSKNNGLVKGRGRRMHGRLIQVLHYRGARITWKKETLKGGNNPDALLHVMHVDGKPCVRFGSYAGQIMYFRKGQQRWYQILENGVVIKNSGDPNIFGKGGEIHISKGDRVAINFVN